MKYNKTKKTKFSAREIKLAEMRNGRIDKKYLKELIMDYKFKKKLDSNMPMPRELAEVVLIIIQKNLGSPRWRQYTEDWKEEFRGRAIEHVLKYSHNFDPEKSRQGKGNDPYNYIAMIVGHAFIQSWKKCKKHLENITVYNQDVLYNKNNWDEDQEMNPDIDLMSPNIERLDWGHFGTVE